jgi:hypothetical protein
VRGLGSCLGAALTPVLAVLLLVGFAYGNGARRPCAQWAMQQWGPAQGTWFAVCLGAGLCGCVDGWQENGRSRTP